MKKRLFALLAALCILLGCLAGCNGNGGDTTTASTAGTTPADPTGSQQQQEFNGIDYAGQVKLDMDSETAKQEVTVKSYIDGDTTHFFVPDSVV